MIWYKLYKRHEIVLAIADEELMDREFEDGDSILKVGHFYKGELIDEGEIPNLLKQATVINAVGDRSVGTLVAEGLVKTPMTVSGIPHVQVLLSS